MESEHENDPLHGITLAMMLERLVEKVGWEGMAENIPIRCFSSDPSIKSSLTFLRRTEWARAKVERMYLWTFFRKRPVSDFADGKPSGRKPERGDSGRNKPRGGS